MTISGNGTFLRVRVTYGYSWLHAVRYLGTASDSVGKKMRDYSPPKVPLATLCGTYISLFVVGQSTRWLCSNAWRLTKVIGRSDPFPILTNLKTIFPFLKHSRSHIK